MSTNSATVITEPMDPTDLVDYALEFDEFLESGETIEAGFTVSPTVESAALGFELSTTRPPSLETGDKNIIIWAQVDASNREDEVFWNDGIDVAVEATIDTSDSRRYQRTWLIKVKQL